MGTGMERSAGSTRTRCAHRGRGPARPSSRPYRDSRPPRSALSSHPGEGNRRCRRRTASRLLSGSQSLPDLPPQGPQRALAHVHAAPGLSQAPGKAVTVGARRSSSNLPSRNTAAPTHNSVRRFRSVTPSHQSGALLAVPVENRGVPGAEVATPPAPPRPPSPVAWYEGGSHLIRVRPRRSRSADVREPSPPRTPPRRRRSGARAGGVDRQRTASPPTPLPRPARG